MREIAPKKSQARSMQIEVHPLPLFLLTDNLLSRLEGAYKDATVSLAKKLTASSKMERGASLLIEVLRRQPHGFASQKAFCAPNRRALFLQEAEEILKRQDVFEKDARGHLPMDRFLFEQGTFREAFHRSNLLFCLRGTSASLWEKPETSPQILTAHYGNILLPYDPLEEEFYIPLQSGSRLLLDAKNGTLRARGVTAERLLEAMKRNDPALKRRREEERERASQEEVETYLLEATNDAPSSLSSAPHYPRPLFARLP